jgi:hypothetical protein
MPDGFPETIPHTIEAGALERAKQVTSAPAGEPVHHTTIDAEKRFESITPATGLDPDLQWYCLGLAYCLIKIDRSLFEVFQAAGNLSMPIQTHQADHPIMQIPGVNLVGNPWSGIVQGIPPRHGAAFREFVSSYQFNRIDTGDQWCCTFQDIRSGDPMVSGERRGVNIWYALPHNLTTKRRIALLREPGLMLADPILGVVSDD